jgi:hypothetical protein
MLTLAVKPQWLPYKLVETIEKPCSDFLAHTSEVCNGIPFVQRVSGCQGYSRLMGNVYNLCRVSNYYSSHAHGHERHGPSHDWCNLGWVLVKSWLGCVEVGFIRLWVGHDETP